MSDELLTSRKARNFVVLRNVAVEADVFEMLPDKMACGVSGARSFSRRLEVIESLHEFDEAAIHEIVARNPSVPFVVIPAPFDFVLEGFLQLLATHDHLNTAS